MNSIPKIPTPVNEPVLSYAPGTPERADLKRTLKELSGRQLEIPLVIGGKDVHTGRTVDVVMPHCHRHVLAKAHRSEEHTSELQSPCNLVCRLLLEKKKNNNYKHNTLISIRSNSTGALPFVAAERNE